MGRFWIMVRGSWCMMNRGMVHNRMVNWCCSMMNKSSRVSNWTRVVSWLLGVVYRT